MVKTDGAIEVDDDRRRLAFDLVTAWLGTTHWSPGIGREKVEKAARGSAVVVGAYRDGRQVGYLRVVSDGTTFAWIADVFVDEAARGKGVARAMVRFALGHPELQGIRRWMLATRDAHGVYAGVGFKVVDRPESLMYWRAEEGREAR